MGKFGKHIFVMLLILGIGYKTFGQRHMHMHSFHGEPNFTGRSYGQGFEGFPSMRRVQLVKENFLNRQLSLTPEQSDRFWPVYRQYQQELGNVRRLKRLNNSDAQANGPEQINKDLSYESQLLSIRKHYNEEFLRVLPPEKVSELYKSEREFTDEMIKQLNERTAPQP
jgi:hypothetical protein